MTNARHSPSRRLRSVAMKRAFALLSALSGLAGLSGAAEAYDLPALNLGFTSFLDGAPPAGPGWYPTQYFQFYTAGHLTDRHGDRLPLPKQNINVFIGLTQILYVSPIPVGPGSFGFDALLPYIPASSADDGLNHAVLKANQGIGDLLFGPFYQLAPIMGAKGPVFLGRVEAQIIAPTGNYDPTAAVNPGSNFWSFDPYVAGTLFLTPNWTVSTRLHYLWNATNDRPNVGFGPAVLTTKAGEAVHANFATEYAFTDSLKLGVDGYWLQQTTDTEANGTSVPGRRERVAALGPGALWTINKNNYLFFNSYFEFAAQNRPEGERFTLRWVSHFD